MDKRKTQASSQLTKLAQAVAACKPAGAGLAVACALMLSGTSAFAQTIAIDNTNGDTAFSSGTVSGYDYGLYSDTAEASLSASNISIDANTYGAYANGSSGSIVLGGSSTESVAVTLGSASAPASTNIYGLYAVDGGSISVSGTSFSTSLYSSANAYSVFAQGSGSEITIDADNITISTSGDGTVDGASIRGVQAYDGATVTLGNSNSTITINSTSSSVDGVTVGIFSRAQGSTVIVNGQSLVVNVDGGDDAYVVYGIHIQNNTTQETDPDNIASIVINAENTTVNSSQIGLSAFSQGQLTVNGNITVNAESAISARGASTIKVNESGTSTVVLNGNINFNYDAATSGTKVDANVYVNLTGSGSSWTGNAVTTYGAGEYPSEEYSTVTGLDLVIADGAQWNVTVVDEYEGDEEGQAVIAINDLTFNDGIINITESTDQTVTIDTMNGTGGTVNVAASTEDGATVTSSTLKINATSSTTHIDVYAVGITSDDITDQQAAVDSLYASALDLDETAASSTATVNIAEGDVAGALSATADASGEVSTVTESDNTVNSSIIDIAASNYLFFRSAINDVSSRMGDLRSMPKTAGAWVRYYGGQNKYSDKGQKEKYNTLQIGADKFINDNFYLGATFSYTDGDGTLKNGSTDDKSYSFGIYGGWLGDHGEFVDVIIKRHRLKTDFDLYNTLGNSTGSYHNWGTSASVEAGWRFNCPANGFYAEPQVELQLGRVDSVNYSTSRGVKVNQDGINSIIGRAGVAVGYTFPENKGNAYAKVSVLHDWKGEVEATFSKDGTSRTYKEDLGGTWGEFAVGGTYNPTKNLSAYGQVKTSTGSPVRNPWQVSVGIRYNF